MHALSGYVFRLLQGLPGLQAFAFQISSAVSVDGIEFSLLIGGAPLSHLLQWILASTSSNLDSLLH